MTSKNWSSAYAPACATINSKSGAGASACQSRFPALIALFFAVAAPLAAPPQPAIALIDSSDAAQWQTFTRDANWQILSAASPADANIDTRVQNLAAAVEAGI